MKALVDSNKIKSCQLGRSSIIVALVFSSRLRDSLNYARMRPVFQEFRSQKRR